MQRKTNKHETHTRHTNEKRAFSRPRDRYVYAKGVRRVIHGRLELGFLVFDHRALLYLPSSFFLPPVFDLFSFFCFLEKPYHVISSKICLTSSHLLASVKVTSMIPSRFCPAVCSLFLRWLSCKLTSVSSCVSRACWLYAELNNTA